MVGFSADARGLFDTSLLEGPTPADGSSVRIVRRRLIAPETKARRNGLQPSRSVTVVPAGTTGVPGTDAKNGGGSPFLEP